MKLTCAVCGRERDEETMKVFTPTFAEKEAMKKMGESDPKDKYAYCRACVRVLSKPATAIALMQGIVQVQARASGVPMQQAQAISDRYGKKLLSLKPHS